MLTVLGLLASPAGRALALLAGALALAGGLYLKGRMEGGRPAWRRGNAMCWRRYFGRTVRAALLIGAMTTLAGCATTTPSAATRGACGAFRPISWASADTDPTIRQVKAHNAVGRELCNWRGT